MRDARNAILNVAMELFANKGYAASSIREICNAAGVTKPVLYYHFRGKEHLYQVLMLDIFNQTRKNLLRLSEYRGSLRDRLVLYVSSEFRDCTRTPSSVKLLFRMMFSPEGEYPRFNFIEEFKRERKIIAQFIGASEGKGKQPDAGLMSGALMGMMLMQILEYFFTGKRTLTQRKAERLVDLLIPSSISAGNTTPVGKERRRRS
jgi:AcrR family transcriptional regulator